MEAAMRKIGNLYMFTVGDKKIINCNLPQQPTKKERKTVYYNPKRTFLLQLRVFLS